MNLDDMGCVGCVDNILLSSTIGRNKHLISGDVVTTLIEATTAFVEKMRQYDINIQLAGGETADVGDIVRTIDVGYTAFARMKRNDLIVNDIKNNDVIVGFASYGKSIYENEYNGGMGSNGLTSARHDVLSKFYATKYPESYDPNTADSVVYTGNKLLTDSIQIGDITTNIGKLILSPTRTFLPLLKKALYEFRPYLHGIIHNTGGGQTKVKKFVSDKQIIKDNLLPIPPLFELIKTESGTDWREMYQVFNMGTRLEMYVPQSIANDLITLSQSFGIDAQIIGHVKEYKGESVIIKSDYGNFEY